MRTAPSFLKFDLVQAYFQLRVAEESVHLLVFIYPWGKYAMLRMPMGWTSSGDYLNIETRCLLSGLDRSIKIFDDLLLQPQSRSKACQLCAKVLSQAIAKNLKFSVSKFRVAPSVTFSGLLLTAKPNGDVDIKPDRKRIEKLLDMPIPRCKEDALSLLGLLGTLMLWLPSLLLTTDLIRSLIRKHTHISGPKSMIDV